MEEDFYPNLTVRENLLLPLIFKTIDKNTRDELIDKVLSEQGLTEAANKFDRYLTEEEGKRTSSLRKQLWKAYPELNEFRKVLKKKREAGLCLALIQFESFANISKNLKMAIKEIQDNNMDRAAYLLEEAVDRLTLRVVLSSFIETPTIRVVEVLLLVLRNYRDLFKYRFKMEKSFVEDSKDKTITSLNSLSESFEELIQKPHVKDI